jgi:Mycothiol maleylpyruvate isomerase N-terminal domain
VALSIDLETARPACVASVRALLDAVDGIAELELLAASRCRGWTRLDVVVHVIGGWHEMLGGLVSPVDASPTVDSATYWTAFADELGDDEPVLTLMAQRRRTAAYARPAAACEQLRDVGGAVLRGIEAMPDRRCLWQGHVFEPGDFLTIWAVEHVVHHLDLLAGQPPADGLRLARRSVEALLEEPLPEAWSDQTATLVGTGRLAPPVEVAHLVERLPVL